MASVRLGPAKAKDPHPAVVYVCSRGFELTWAVLLTHGREEENEKKATTRINLCRTCSLHDAPLVGTVESRLLPVGGCSCIKLKPNDNLCVW